MTDIFSATLQLIFWSGLYLAIRFAWDRAVTLVIIGPLAALMAWESISPIEIVVRTSIGNPLNLILRLASLAMILLFLFESSRKAQLLHPKANVS